MGDDGAELLGSEAVGDLLAAAVAQGGGQLRSWTLNQVDAHPHRSTTATYLASVDWPFGRRDELVGVSARAAGPTAADSRAEVFADGEREVAVWLYPNDPDLPGLGRAAYAAPVTELFSTAGLVSEVTSDQIELAMVTYRPRRRAVLRVRLPDRRVYYVKVLRPELLAEVEQRHLLLRDAGVPVPEVAATTGDGLLILAELPGLPLARAVFEPPTPCTAEDIIDVLDTLPQEVATLPRRPGWADAVDHYATIISTAAPWEADRLAEITAQVQAGLSGLPPGQEPTHGDLHEGQVQVADGRVVGILDVDTVGPGRRADDLACLIAHLSTIQRMNPAQEARVHALLRTWVPVFDLRVDPVELRLRAAAVIISLATGPHRSQEPNWQQQTAVMLDAAEALVRQVT